MTITTRLLQLLLTLTLSALSCTSYAVPELVFLTWQDYIDASVVQDFEQQEHCRIRFVYYDDDDERNMILANTNATGFDLVMIDQIMIETYKGHDWLLPLTYADIPNARHVLNPWNPKPNPEPFYAVYYFWGGIGIVYRKDLMQKKPDSWLDIYQPATYLKNKIMLLNTVQSTYGLALKALGYSFNSTDPAEVEQATRLLIDARPLVREFRNIRMSDDSEMLDGSTYAAVTYNGDALIVMEKSDQLDFVYPREGTALWVDAVVVLKNTKQPALAKKFINFINRPEIAARNSLNLNYASANIAAQPMLPNTFKQNPYIYPAQSQMNQNEIFQQLPTAHMRRITTLMVQIMAQTDP